LRCCKSVCRGHSPSAMGTRSRPALTSRLFTPRYRATTTIDCMTAIALSVTSLRLVRPCPRALYQRGSTRNACRSRPRPRSAPGRMPSSRAHGSHARRQQQCDLTAEAPPRPWPHGAATSGGAITLLHSKIHVESTRFNVWRSVRTRACHRRWRGRPATSCRLGFADWNCRWHNRSGRSRRHGNR